MVVGESAPVLVREVFNRAREHVGFLRLTGGGRELPVRDVARKRRLFKDVELIAVDAVERKACRRFQVVLPDLHRLAGEAVDQVEHHGGVVVGAELVEALQNRFAVVDALHGLADLAVEGLNAQ